MSEKLYVVLPAYNEEENIEAVVRSWYAVLDGKDEGSRIVIADSGSKDRTHEKLVALQGEFPKLEVLSDTGRYHGEKVIALYDYAIKNGADWIFQTDSDGQTNPDEFGRNFRKPHCSRRRKAARVRRKGRVLFAPFVFRRARSRRERSVPIDESRGCREISSASRQRLQSAKHHDDDIFCVLRRKAHIPRDFVQAAAGGSQFGQYSANHKNRLKSSWRF